MHIINTLGPVFLIIVLGALLRRFRFLDDCAVRIINSSCYWVGLPCLLVLKIGTASSAYGSAKSTLFVVLSTTAVLVLLSLLLGFALRMKPATLATFAHVAFRGNLAYVGLPVVVFAFAGTLYEGQAEAVAAIVLGVTVVIYNVLAVILHLVSTHSMNWQSLRRMGMKIVTNPLLIACVLGLVWNKYAHLEGIWMPVMVSRTLLLLGQFALPMALICVGAKLVTTPVRAMAGGAIASAVIKVGLGPAVGMVIAHFAGVGSMEAGLACILLGTPSAVASYVMTEQLDGDSALAAGSIVISTLISIVTLSTIISMIG